MNRTALIILVIALAAWTVFAELSIEEKARLQKNWTITAPASQSEVKVDNIDGSIEVVGTDGREVEMVADQTIRAESNEKLQKARQEVKLQLGQKENSIEAYVDVPWRCRCGGNNRGWRHYGYKVSYDFHVRVPREVRLYLRNVNGGEIKVRGSSGAFDIENINGGIQLLETGGSGHAYALNGKLTAYFDQNPRAASYFGSLNGDVDLYFRPGLGADFRLKNFNGGIYTDLPVSYLPSPNAQPEHREGKFVYRSNDFFGARVGSGGPEIKVEGFNGSIRIHEREK
jgi:hypothetical protein